MRAPFAYDLEEFAKTYRKRPAALPRARSPQFEAARDAIAADFGSHGAERSE
jgi:hypothetical protein